MTKDKMIKEIMKRMSQRADDGIKKYGSTMAHSKKSFVAWVDDAQEEFVEDFVAAWTKVMTLDRFDLDS